MMLLTPLFAAILGLMYIYLSLQVVKIRFSHRISMGVGENRGLEKAVRIHANFAEYVPMTLILLWFVETMLMSQGIVLVAGTLLIIARVMHVIGMAKPREWLILRQLGVVISLSIIGFLAVYLLYWYMPFSL